MRPSVRVAFLPFTERLEGCVRWMYLDILGLVTVGYGNLIDPIQTALDGLYRVRGNGLPATRDQIAAEWRMVKGHKTAAKHGHRVLEGPTTLRLTDEGLEKIVGDRLALNETVLRKRFPDMDAWPADAQLATHSMAWACGANFHFPRLAAALRAKDFELAAKECHIDTDGPDHIPGTADDNHGVIQRNVDNKRMYANAALALAEEMDPEELHWPLDLRREVATVPDLGTYRTEPPAAIVHAMPDTVTGARWTPGDEE